MANNLKSCTRDYSLRHRGDSTKFAANSDVLKTICNNCISLSLENDRLRRLISILHKHIENSDCAVTTPLSDSGSILVSEPCSSVESIETQTPSIEFNHACCGTDKTEHSTNDLACGTNDSSVLVSINGTDHIVRPFNLYDQKVFDIFDAAQIDSSTTYSHSFGNRSVAYYGKHPYTYTGGSHPPRSFNENQYLKTVLEAVNERYPEFDYNSAMITRYRDGKDFMPLHADDEDCISQNSSIMTLSFGETRALQFRPKDSHSFSDATLNLAHGDVVLMSQLSQSHFLHTIPKEPFSSKPRISITLRLIVESDCDNYTSSPPVSCGTDGLNDSSLGTPPVHINPVVKITTQPSASSKPPSHSTPVAAKHQPNTNCSSEEPKPKSSTVYISSSMFSALDSGKLSSKAQDATVFSYRGATVSTMHKKFQSDPIASKIDSQSVQRIFLLTGTNNIDDILNSPRGMRDKLIDPSSRCSMEKLTKTFDCIESFVKFLKGWAPNAKIILLKLLPRESRARNVVITRINSYLHSLASKYDNLKLLDVEKDRYLFVNDAGYRKSDFFSAQGEDNVHLNRRGVVRLANHLKYIAHNF